MVYGWNGMLNSAEAQPMLTLRAPIEFDMN